MSITPKSQENAGVTALGDQMQSVADASKLSVVGFIVIVETEITVEGDNTDSTIIAEFRSTWSDRDFALVSVQAVRHMVEKAAHGDDAE